MNIKEIVDKIIKEADVNPAEYTVADRLDDIHQTRLELVTLARQYGQAINKKVAQTETLISGDQSFTKTFVHAEIDKIEYRATGGSENDYICLEKRRDCVGGRCSGGVGNMTYTEDTNTVYIWNAQEGELRITYIDDRITKWTEADYTTGTATPDELKEVYHALLWMAQVVRHTGYYSKERYEQVRIEYDSLIKKYIDDLKRNVDFHVKIETDYSHRSKL